MRIIDSYSPGANFWALHPQFLASNPFKEMWENDQSNNKTESSTLMWFVVFCYDMDSKYVNLPTAEKNLILGEDYCGNDTYYEDFKGLIDPCATMYCRLQDTQAKRSMRNWRKNMEDRDIFLATATYTFDSYDDRGKLKKGTADQLDAMHGRTPKFWSDYARILEEMDKEETGGEGRGGSMPSSSDEGDI